MRLRAIVMVFVFALAGIGSSHGLDDSSSMIEVLNKSYVGKDAMLRGFYCDSRLEYDADGKPLRSPKTGAWTACGFVKFSSFRLKDGRLEIEAQREGIRFDERTMVQVPGGTVKIGFLLPDSANSETVQKELNRIFFDQEKLVDVVPDYWKCFLQQPLNESVGNHCIPTRSDFDRSKHKINGVIAPRALNTPDPDYSTLARNLHYQGTVLLSCNISPEGRAEDVNVIRPLGLGLDDEAVAALWKWKFEPARYKSDHSPMKVPMTLEINFHMGMPPN